MAVKAVIFDFYGTLAQDEPGDTLEDRMQRRGFDWDWSVESAMSRDGEDHPHAAESRDAYEAFRRPERIAALEAMGVPAAQVEEVYADIYGRVVARTVYPDVVPVLEQLRAEGYRLAICSNWDWDLDKVLDQCGLTDWFEVAITSARAGCRKPHRRIFEQTLAPLGVEPGDAVFVGDTVQADIEGPLAVGMRPVHVWRWRPRPRPALPEGVPALDDLSPLPALLSG